MFLMFRLHRPDVLPVGDLGILKAVQKLYRLRKRPDPKKLLKIGEAWRPYRSVACWYLWRSLSSDRVRAQSRAPTPRSLEASGFRALRSLDASENSTIAARRSR